MLGSIKYNLANLTNFSGRDARQTFWYYVLFLVVANFAIGMIAAIPMYAEMFSGAFDAARSGADEQAVNAAMFASMRDMMRTQMLISSGISLVMAALFSASFVRRLHDSGKSGWFLLLALVPYLGTQAYAIANFDAIMAMVERSMTVTTASDAMANQSQFFGYSLVGWLGYLVVVVFGVLKSNEGPNRYGEAPVRF